LIEGAILLVANHFDDVIVYHQIAWGGFGAEIYIISVDGVHCRIFKPRTDPGSKHYSHKSNSAGVMYELRIAIRSSRLVWIAGQSSAAGRKTKIKILMLWSFIFLPGGK
jgi:hypothetical protein